MQQSLVKQIDIHGLWLELIHLVCFCFSLVVIVINRKINAVIKAKKKLGGITWCCYENCNYNYF